MAVEQHPGRQPGAIPFVEDPEGEEIRQTPADLCIIGEEPGGGEDVGEIDVGDETLDPPQTHAEILHRLDIDPAGHAAGNQRRRVGHLAAEHGRHAVRLLADLQGFQVMGEGAQVP